MAAAFPLPPSPPLEDIYAAPDYATAIHHNIEVLSHHETLLHRRMTRDVLLDSDVPPNEERLIRNKSKLVKYLYLLPQPGAPAVTNEALLHAVINLQNTVNNLQHTVNNLQNEMNNRFDAIEETQRQQQISRARAENSTRNFEGPFELVPSALHPFLYPVAPRRLLVNGEAIQALNNQEANSYIQFYGLGGHGLGHAADNLLSKKRAIGLAIGLHQLTINLIE